MTVIVKWDYRIGEKNYKDWWMGEVIHFGGAARAPKIHNLFQIADVDSGVIRWVNAELVTHILPKGWRGITLQALKSLGLFVLISGAVASGIWIVDGLGERVGLLRDCWLWTIAGLAIIRKHSMSLRIRLN